MDDEQPPEPAPAPTPPPTPPPPAPPGPPSPPPAYPPPPGPAPPPVYGAPPPAPPGYGAPPSYAPPGYEPPRTEGQAVGALVVSIVALFICGIILGPVALILANQANQKIVASGGRLTGSGMVTAARVISIIAIVLGVIGFAIIVTQS